MKIIGHRGACGYAPENTISSIKKALELGVDSIEFDVHSLPSGEVVLMHDHSIDRTTDGSGYLLHHNFDKLRELNAGENEKIPTLEEALDVINRQVPVNIEMKGPGSAIGVGRIIRKYLNHGWQPSDFLVSSFNHPNLKKFHDYLPEIKIGALQESIPLNYAAFAEEIGAVAVCPGEEFVDQAYVDDAHERGLEVYVWTVNAAAEVRRMQDLGVDGIFTNFPDTCRAVLERYQTVSAAA